VAVLAISQVSRDFGLSLSGIRELAIVDYSEPQTKK
jgi:hypothetical protein